MTQTTTMKKLLKATLALTAIILVLSLLGEAFMALCFPQYTFKDHWIVPLYFWIFYLGALLSLDTGMTGVAFTRYIIGFKAVKMFASVFFITIAAFLMRDNVLPVLFTFFVYYLLLLVPECAYSIYLKKHIK